MRKKLYSLGAVAFLTAVGCLWFWGGASAHILVAFPQPQSSPIAITANNTLLVNVNPTANTVSLFNILVNPPVKLAEIPVGTEPVSVAIAGSKAYVANSASGSVSVINLTTQKVVNNITVGAEPMAVAAAPNGTMVYVANAASNSLTVVQTSNDSVVTTVDLSAFGTSPKAIGVTNNGDGNDADQTILVAMFFGQLRAGKTFLNEGQDDQREGHLVAISAATNTILGRRPTLSSWDRSPTPVSIPTASSCPRPVRSPRLPLLIHRLLPPPRPPSPTNSLPSPFTRPMACRT